MKTAERETHSYSAVLRPRFIVLNSIKAISALRKSAIYDLLICGIEI